MRFNKRIMFCVLTCFLALRVGAFAQEEPTAEHETTSEDLKDESTSVGATQTGALPEIRFTVSELPHERKLSSSDPKLLEQKYFALVLSEPLSDKAIDYLEGFIPNELNLVASRASHPRGSLLHTAFDRQEYSQGSRRTDFFAPFVERLPADARVSQDAIDFFLSSAVEKGFLGFIPPTPSNMRTHRYAGFQILASSEEEAKERAKALVTMLRYGIAVPLQDALRNLQTAQQQELKQLEADLEKANREMTVLHEQLEAQRDVATDIGAEELNRLKAEWRLLNVDVAGAKARIEATEKLIASLREILKPAGGLGGFGGGGAREELRLSKLEDLKIEAEIEVAGLEARRQVLERLIEGAVALNQLRAKKDAANSEVNSVEAKIVNTANTLSNLSPFIEEVEALYSHVDVTIGPIQWTE